MYNILVAVLVLGIIAVVAAIVLYWCSVRFAVKEDPRLNEISAVLPQANCGGCGFAGCSGMASALVDAADKGSIAGLSCPVGGKEVMEKIASILGMAVSEGENRIAVVRCNGSCAARERIVQYDGLHTCSAMNTCSMGETACGFGCLGCGDCEKACSFGGIKINPDTKLPEINPELCTACGACAAVCPRHIIELRPRGVKERRIYVGCVNTDKGALAVKACKVSCIGCGKCVKECNFDAIHVENNVAYIDYAKCRLCRKCEKACPRGAIVSVNFPMPKVLKESGAPISERRSADDVNIEK